MVETKKLTQFISDMDEMDDACGNQLHIKEICHKIYNDYYNEWGKHLDEVKTNFLKMIEKFQGIHLQSSRIKKIDSLLEKVIKKRHNNLNNPSNQYHNITGENYKDIVTDLIGMRLIINYRGKWNVIHEEIVEKFPYVDEIKYTQHPIVQHSKDGSNLLAQIPIVYYAIGDNTQDYSHYKVTAKLHKMGYRSIHYIVSFQGVYIEIQVRTIYDEAWSDCDHSYVYKQDENKSHTALEKMSEILCQLTNVSNDMGETMRDIFEKEAIEDMHDGNWTTSQECVRVFDHSLERIKKTYQELQNFRGHLFSE